MYFSETIYIAGNWKGLTHGPSFADPSSRWNPLFEEKYAIKDIFGCINKVGKIV